MASENIALDENGRWGLAGITNDSNQFILNGRINPVTNRLIVEGHVTSSNTSIGDVIPGGTEGSVLFIGAGSTLAQDNANFFWDDSNMYLGLGTDTPDSTLHVVGTFHYVDGNQANGKILTSDASGNATWQIAPTGGLNDPGANGIVIRTALDTTTARTLTGTSNRIAVTNGTGVAGNPTVDIDSAYVGQTSITTLGTIGTGVWQGTTLAIAHGGTGQTTANNAFNALAPSQATHSGDFLTTDGTNTSWVTVTPGTGTVTTVSVVTANGFAGTVATATTTPSITLQATPTGILQSNGTAISSITVGSGLNFSGGTLAATGAFGTVVYPTENISAGNALAITNTNFASATTELDFGKSTTYQKSAFEVFGNGVAMSSMKIALAGRQDSIAFDAVSNSSGASPLTWSHTCTGSNRYLLVQIVWSAGTTISSVTYNGVSLTNLLTSGSGQRIYGLVNPTSGTHDIVVTMSSGSIDAAQAISYTGVHQTSSIDSINQFTTPNFSSGTVVQPISTTVVNEDCWLVGFCKYFTPGNTITVPLHSDRTDRELFGAGGPLISDSNGTVGTGSQTINFEITTTGPNSDNMNMFAVSLRPLDGTSDNAVIRIETDSAGAPSGTLANVNATGTVTGSTLTSLLADTTVTFGGSFTLTGGTKYWIVLTRSGSLSNGDFYSAGYLPATSRVFQVDNYDGATWGITSSNSVGYALGNGFDWVTLSDSSLANSNNFFGISESTVSVGSSAVVSTAGVTSTLLGLIPNQTYFLSTAGTLATTGSVKVGKAIQSNDFLIVQPPL